MTQMNFYETETDSDIQKRLGVVKGQGIWERDGVEVWGPQMQTTGYGMDK